MPLSYRIYDGTSQVDEDRWNEVHRAGGNPFTDLRMARAVERSMAADTRCWPVIISDGERPVAVTVFSRYRVDGALLAGGWIAKLTVWMRRIMPGYLHLKVLFCGLPVSAGQRPLAIAAGADTGAVIQTLNAALEEMAIRLRARLIVIKEFEQEDAPWLEPPCRRYGYRRADSLPMNRFENRFGSFEEYLAARGKRTRYNIRRSLRKFDEAGLRVVQMAGGEEAARLYTDQVHRLYEAVLARSPTKLESLPAEFFRQVSRQMGGDAHFTFIYQGERVVGVSCSVADAAVFRMMFCGIDYEVNEASDLYFNLMFRDLDRGLRHGAAAVNVGQSSDQFKARLGCRQVPLHFYIKGRGVMRTLLWMFSRWALPSVELLPPSEAFQSGNPQSTV